ncbi:hypothetical protein, partial [Campylobacter concisus]|uniref:hypothetical protein n=2 Tax=Campylobacter concisus TaxID=199 RepID=UPI001CB7D478
YTFIKIHTILFNKYLGIISEIGANMLNDVKMQLCDILLKIHKQIENKEIQKISKKDMAERLNVSSITYIEWLRGVNQPLGMKVLLKMLSMLGDDKIVMNIMAWNGNRKVLKLSDMLLKIHKQIEDKEIKSISQRDMAQRLGVSLSAYTSWLGGAKEPIAMIALLDMLAMLDDEGIVRVVREQESNKVIGDKIL